MRHRHYTRHGNGPISEEELKKYDTWADEQEAKQLERFNLTTDPFNFFESEFEQDLRDQIKFTRKMVLSERETRKRRCSCEEMDGLDRA